MNPILLAGGWDPLGRAGLSADIEALARLELQPAAALVTAQTAQDDRHMQLWGTPISRLRQQLQLLSTETSITHLKTGILVDEQQVNLLLEWVPDSVEWVLDPVLESSSGRACYLDDCQGEVYRRLIRRADLITPNQPEAEALTGMVDVEPADLLEGLKALGARRILLKGGHGEGPEMEDLLAGSQPPQSLRQPRLPGSFRGTGCRLASLVIGFRSQGLRWGAAVQEAHRAHGRWLKERALDQGS